MIITPQTFTRVTQKQGEQLLAGKYENYKKMTYCQKMDSLQQMLHEILEQTEQPDNLIGKADCFARMANRIYKQNEPGPIAKLFYKIHTKVFGEDRLFFDKFKSMLSYNKMTNELATKCPESAAIFAAKKDDIELLKASINKLEEKLDNSLITDIINGAAKHNSSKTISYLLDNAQLLDSLKLNSSILAQLESAKVSDVTFYRSGMFLSQFAKDPIISKLGRIGFEKLDEENLSSLGNLIKTLIDQQDTSQIALPNTISQALTLFETVDRSAHKEVLDYMTALISEAPHLTEDENTSLIDSIKNQKSTECIKSMLELSTKIVKQNKNLISENKDYLYVLIERLGTTKSEIESEGYIELASRLIEKNSQEITKLLSDLDNQYLAVNKPDKKIKLILDIFCVIVDNKSMEDGQKTVLNSLIALVDSSGKKAELYSDIACAVVKTKKLDDKTTEVLGKLVSQMDSASYKEAEKIAYVTIKLMGKNSELSEEWLSLLETLSQGTLNTEKLLLMDQLLDKTDLKEVNIALLNKIINLTNSMERKRSLFHWGFSNPKLNLLMDVVEDIIKNPIEIDINTEDIDSFKLITFLQTYEKDTDPKDNLYRTIFFNTHLPNLRKGVDYRQDLQERYRAVMDRLQS